MAPSADVAAAGLTPAEEASPTAATTITQKSDDTPFQQQQQQQQQQVPVLDTASSSDLPCVTQLNGIGIKGLKAPTYFSVNKAIPFLSNTPSPIPAEALLAATSDETVGRVPDGTVFSVPETHDLIQTLFSPSETKTMPEWITLGIMGTTIALFFFTNTPREAFLAIFIFWRCMYNGGLGVLLNAQSKDRGLVRLAKKIGLGPTNPEKPRTKWAQFLVNQITKKMSKKGAPYDYDAMPLEFNTWILYRGLVDVILVNDFTSYIVFAVSYYQSPEGGYGGMDALRYAAGILMLLFNLWVKTDAHRVVKDFAWYWGDFFFLVDASLTFDGVFEMAPHPMYSVGYIGFYATALIAQSYWVLFVSLAAHAAQMIFLHVVENPHIDKTYNPPVQKKAGDSGSSLNKYFGRDLIVFQNLDWFRSTDLQTVAIVAYTCIAALAVGPVDCPWKFWFYVGQTLFWRFVHTYGLGAILYLQSNHRTWNRHFIKHGETPRDAFQHWKVIYNTTQMMSYVSFIICALRFFVIPESILSDMFLLRATLGALFVILHSWIAVSIYEVIGSSGWFYGDFFIDELRYRSGPVYSGLYRYLDNPLLYTFSCWGIAMTCGSPALYAITLFGQVSNWLFLRYVEQPHMRRMYGSQIRQEAGVERVLKSKVGDMGRGVEKLAKDLDLMDVLNRIKDVKKTGEKELRKVMGPEAWKEFVARARGRKAARGQALDMTPPESEDEVDSIASDSPSRLQDGMRLRNKASIDSQFSVSSQEDGQKKGIKNTRRDSSKNLPMAVERIIEELEDLVDQARPRMRAMVGETALKLVGDTRSAVVPVDLYSVRFPSCRADEPATFRLGQPIVIEFTAATDTVTARDWIGLYSATANPNTALTTTKSQGRWMFVTGGSKDEWDADSESAGVTLVKASAAGHSIGRVPVELSSTINEKSGMAHSVVRGQLTFSNDRLPWAVGVYEARYHYQGKHDVIAISRVFEIVADEYQWQESSAETAAAEEKAVTEALEKIVETCADIDVAGGEQELRASDNIMDRVKVDNCLDVSSYAKYKEVVARRIVYTIKQTFGVEFSWKVVGLDGTTGQLAKRVCSARHALQPCEYEK
ncbi:phosphatidylethanolamine N-methyltransferase [Powellomyces hirtus]|uniref:Phosphatidylethanolamine N-methyltransferase n=1 Tax=Powellomyces hirtus TaxID=109895 RepID=A0A507DUP4_9FUNG|nr:phosphatidylethanolamine N-methyltransferase [Powellomyces hirtus]